MKNFDLVTNVAGAFPNVLAGDDSGPAAEDGTGLEALWVNEIMGAFQALLNGASLSPSGTTETCGAASGSLIGSQIAEAIQLMCGYPGEIFAYPAPTASLTLPTGMRALKLEGQTISIATGTVYARLGTAVYCGDGANATAPAFYKTSDAGGTLRSTAGTYMVLPDFRGCFLRGLDLAAAIDPDGATREMGDLQAAAVGPHGHDHLYTTGPTEVHHGSIPDGDGSHGASAVVETGTTNWLYTGTTGTDIGTETHPANTAIAWCIRY